MKVNASGMTARIQEISQNKNLRSLTFEPGDALIRVILKIATKSGKSGEADSQYDLEVPPSVILIEEMLGTPAVTMFKRTETVINGETGEEVSVPREINEGFLYPDGKDCIEVMKMIFDTTFNLTENEDSKLKLEDEWVGNFLSYIYPHILELKSEFPQTKDVNEIREHINNSIEGIFDKVNVSKNTMATNFYKEIILKTFDKIAAKFSEERTDILQWDAPMVSENFNLFQKDAKGLPFRVGQIEEIEGKDTRSTYYKMGRISNLLTKAKYLCLEDSMKLGVTPKDLEYDPTWGENLPAKFLNFRNTVSLRQNLDIYRSAVQMPKTKITIFAIQVKCDETKSQLFTKEPTTSGFYQLSHSTSANSNIQKLYTTFKTGSTAIHPDFNILFYKFPEGQDKISSSQGKTVQDPGLLYNAFLSSEDLKAQFYALFKRISEDKKFTLVRQLTNQLNYVESCTNFRALLDRVENVNCEDQSHPHHGKTWLEKILVFYPNTMQEYEDLFVNELGYDSGSKVAFNALDISAQEEQPTSTTQTVAQQSTQETTVQSAPQQTATDLPFQQVEQPTQAQPVQEPQPQQAQGFQSTTGIGTTEGL